MDRLHEANRVADVMRRREQPKSITTPVRPGNVTVRVPDSSLNRLSAQGQSPALPVSKWTPPVRIPSSRGWLPWPEKSLAHPATRDYSILPHSSVGIILGKGTRRVEMPGANYLDKTRRPKEIHIEGRHGSALRVSANAGFRLPAKRSRHLPAPRHSGAGMRWPSRPMDCSPAATNWTSVSKPVRISFSEPSMVALDGPLGRHHSAIVPPGALPPGKCLPVDISAPLPRFIGPSWARGESAHPRPIPYTEEEKTGPGLVHVPVKIAYGNTTRKTASVDWTPQDSSHPVTPAASGPIAPPTERPAAGLKTRVEERFDSGWKDWIGGVDDWFVDAAGVRTGSLALYSPSMDMRDYEIEFLARIENRSVTWVYRAANFNEYHVGQIALTRGGNYEFRRRTVIGGSRGPSVTVPLRKPPKNQTALTIRMRCAGNEFSVWVEGQSVETWTETRLPIGGVGFMGGPDDRARIYWLRLSPVGGPAKELPKR